MASILDILIQILNIDCGIAQCYYTNEIEAMFYIFFFPTIFIILFIYILTSFIFRGGGKVRGLKLLIAIGAYAFIIFEGLFTMFVGLSRMWWLLTIILVGLFAFIRFLFKGGEEGGSKGALSGTGGPAGYLKGVAADVMSGARADIRNEIKARFNAMRSVIERMKNPKTGDEGQAESAITELNKRGKIGNRSCRKIRT